MTSDITPATAAELAERLSRTELSAVEATPAHLDRHDAVHDSLSAFPHVATRWALATPRGAPGAGAPCSALERAVSRP